MTLQEALELLKKTDAAAFDLVSKEIETLTNKGTGVEAERKKAEDAKTALTEKETELGEFKKAAEVIETNLKKEVDEAKTANKKDDWFKKLFEEEKLKASNLEKSNKTLNEDIEWLKISKKNTDALIANDIEKLYEWLEEDDVKTLKNLAEKYVIEERVAFIVDFKNKFLSGSKKKWGWPKGGSAKDKTTLEDIQAEYDKLIKIAHKTPIQMAAMRKAAKYLNWTLKLPND